jgi:pimeloyl-ACP methyl ester carboxylesterase
MPTRSWSVPVLAAAALVVLAPATPAQKVESETIQFETADAVQIQGTWYKPILDDKTKLVAATTAADAPVVILLHSFKADPSVGGWDSLATNLAAKGFHVLRFDFRGHGKSTVVAKAFWDYTLYPENTKVLSALAKKKPQPLKLEPADLAKEPGYFPMLVNDLMAARIALDRKSDAKQLNTTSVYLIGAGDAATLGMMYMAAEWTRPQKPNDFERQNLRTMPSNYNDPRTSAGKDIAGAVWLSPTRPASMPEASMKNLVKAFPDMRESNPVLCIYGDQDTAGKSGSKFIVDEMLVAKPQKGSKLNEVKLTQMRAIEKCKLVGVGLLGQQVGTEKIIEDYLGVLEKDRKVIPPVSDRKYNDPPYVMPGLLGANVK